MTASSSEHANASGIDAIASAPQAAPTAHTHGTCRVTDDHKPKPVYPIAEPGGESSALRRWTSGTNADGAGALGIMARERRDIAPEILTWRCSDDETNTARIRAWLELRLLFWADGRGVRLRNQARLPDVVHAATREAMRHVRYSGTDADDRAAAKGAGVRVDTWISLRLAGERFLRRTLREATRRYAQALGGAWEIENGVDPYAGNMNLTMHLPNQGDAFCERIVEHAREAEKALIAEIVRVFLGISNAYVVRGKNHLIVAPITLGQSYPRGAVGVLGRVGLVIADRDTDALAAAPLDFWGRPVTGAAAAAAGWTVLVPAFQETNFRLENDPDHPAYALIRADVVGHTVTHRLRAPGVFWLGDWQPIAFEKDDACTHADQMWRATRNTTADDTPGSSDAWEPWWPPTETELLTGKAA